MTEEREPDFHARRFHRRNRKPPVRDGESLAWRYPAIASSLTPELIDRLTLSVREGITGLSYPQDREAYRPAETCTLLSARWTAVSRDDANCAVINNVILIRCATP